MILEEGWKVKVKVIVDDWWLETFVDSTEASHLNSTSRRF